MNTPRTSPATSPAPAPASSSRPGGIKYPKAYSKATAPFRVGTATAEKLVAFVLEQLEPAYEGASDVYVYPFVAGLHGVVAASDSTRNGRVALVYHHRKNVHRAFRRDRKLAYVAKPKFITLPEAWAHINGIDHRLTSAELGLWRQKLLRDSGVMQSKVEVWWWPRELPEDDEDTRNVWRASFGVVQSDGFKINRPPIQQRELIRAIYLDVMVPRWQESAEQPGPHHYPAMIEVADSYLVDAMAMRDIKADRYRVMRAMVALENAGYIVAVRQRRRSSVNVKGIYWYLPGDGTGHTRGSRRKNHLQVRDAITAMRRFLKEFDPKPGAGVAHEHETTGPSESRLSAGSEPRTHISVE
ncbi:MAG: hypothetical protein ABI702_16480 [Burkholderiales bacterium]